jgi:hypothetical protein
MRGIASLLGYEFLGTENSHVAEEIITSEKITKLIKNNCEQCILRLKRSFH